MIKLNWEMVLIKLKLTQHDLTSFSVLGGLVLLGFELTASRLVDRPALFQLS